MMSFIIGLSSLVLLGVSGYQDIFTTSKSLLTEIAEVLAEVLVTTIQLIPVLWKIMLWISNLIWIFPYELALVTRVFVIGWIGMTLWKLVK